MVPLSRFFLLLLSFTFLSITSPFFPSLKSHFLPFSLHPLKFFLKGREWGVIPNFIHPCRNYIIITLDWYCLGVKLLHFIISFFQFLSPLIQFIFSLTIHLDTLSANSNILEDNILNTKINIVKEEINCTREDKNGPKFDPLICSVGCVDQESVEFVEYVKSTLLLPDLTRRPTIQQGINSKQPRTLKLICLNGGVGSGGVWHCYKLPKL